jgi:hypothetical protein
VKIVTRREWQAQSRDGTGPAPLPAQRLYLHHSGGSARNGAAAIRQLEQIGQDRFGAGISYSFAVTPDGTVYEGHSIGRVGTHTKGLNSTARAICAVGNYESARPHIDMLRGIADLIAYGVEQNWWPGLTGGHRDAPGAATACPGRHLYAAIPDLRRMAAERPQEDDMAYVYEYGGSLWVTDGITKRHIRTEEAWNTIAKITKPLPEPGRLASKAFHDDLATVR